MKTLLGNEFILNMCFSIWKDAGAHSTIMLYVFGLNVIHVGCKQNKIKTPQM